MAEDLSVDVDKIALLVRERGIDVSLESTGDGTVTINAGPVDANGYYATSAGPGEFHGDGPAIGQLNDFGIGAGGYDEQNEPYPCSPVLSALGVRTEAEVADLIVRHVRTGSIA